MAMVLRIYHEVNLLLFSSHDQSQFFVAMHIIVAFDVYHMTVYTVVCIDDSIIVEELKKNKKKKTFFVYPCGIIKFMWGLPRPQL